MKAAPGILFFAEAVTLAHAARVHVLASALCGRGYRVTVAMHPRYDRLFPSLPGVRRLPLHTLSGETFLRRLRRGSPLYGYRELRGYVEEELAILDREQPDLVVGDFRLSLAVSARLRGVPLAAIANVHWLPGAETSWPVPEHPLVGMLGLEVAQRLFDRFRPLVFALHALPMRRLRRSCGLAAGEPDLRGVYTDADHLLLADLPQLVKAVLPDRCRYLGPVVWSPPGALPEWWAETEDDRLPNVYVNLGSSGRADLLPRVAAALSGLPVRVLLATAGRVRLGGGGNLRVAEFLPGDQAAARSRLVICNGGSLAAYQALLHGVPVLGIAANLDQHLNMAAIEARDAGVRLRSDRLDETALRRLVCRMLESSRWREGAARLRDEARRCRPAAEFTRFVRTVVGEGRPAAVVSREECA